MISARELYIFCLQNKKPKGLKNLRKLAIALAILLAFIPIMNTIVLAQEPANLDQYYPLDYGNHWAFDYLDDFINADLLTGYMDNDGDYYIRPDQSITRAEFVAILVRALQLTSAQQGKSFDDVKVGQWYYPQVQIASALGVVNGMSETTFEPNRHISRGDIAAMIVRAFGNTITYQGEIKNFTDVPEYWHKENIIKANQVGIISGYGGNLFKPFQNATRAEAVVMLHRALHLQYSDLPNDEMLRNIVLQFEAETNQLLTNKQYNQLFDTNKKYTTGFQWAAADSDVEFILDILKDGGSYSTTLLTTPQAVVVDAWNRFAVVELTNVIFETHIKVDNYELKETEDYSGYYYLKKMPDNYWKIYFVEYTELYN